MITDCKLCFDPIPSQQFIDLVGEIYLLIYFTLVVLVESTQASRTSLTKDISHYLTLSRDT